mmetsp:Transcript_93774/g.264843  ORF Transcript_93774/g.264843 Transcript_93774/m.264843 type:complete len:291 (+) Transcript_93774:1067-1939(+)
MQVRRPHLGYLTKAYCPPRGAMQRRPCVHRPRQHLFAPTRSNSCRASQSSASPRDHRRRLLSGRLDRRPPRFGKCCHSFPRRVPGRATLVQSRAAAAQQPSSPSTRRLATHLVRHVASRCAVSCRHPTHRSPKALCPRQRHGARSIRRRCAGGFCGIPAPSQTWWLRRPTRRTLLVICNETRPERSGTVQPRPARRPRRRPEAQTRKMLPRSAAFQALHGARPSGGEEARAPRLPRDRMLLPRLRRPRHRHELWVAQNASGWLHLGLHPGRRSSWQHRRQRRQCDPMWQL